MTGPRPIPLPGPPMPGCPRAPPGTRVGGPSKPPPCTNQLRGLTGHSLFSSWYSAAPALGCLSSKRYIVNATAPHFSYQWQQKSVDKLYAAYRVLLHGGFPTRLWVGPCTEATICFCFCAFRQENCLQHVVRYCGELYVEASCCVGLITAASHFDKHFGRQQ